MSSQFSFGSGFLYVIPAGSFPTPVLFGTLQDVSLNISYTIKRLLGQMQAPVAIGRGPASYTGKAKAASISAGAYNEIFAGGSSSTGGVLVAIREEGTPVAGAHTVTNGATFADNLEVVDQATGATLTRIDDADTPAAGEYKVNTTTGAYTFVAGDTAPKYFTYSYTKATGPEKSMIYTNQLMGSAPVFSMLLNVPFNQFGTALTYKFYRVVSTKLTLDFKNEDFTVPEFDFECFANDAGQVYQATFSA